MDISASKHIENVAVSALIVCDRDLKIVYEDYQLVEMKEPYVPGFLAFREVNLLVNLINDLKKMLLNICLKLFQQMEMEFIT